MFHLSWLSCGDARTGLYHGGYNHLVHNVWLCITISSSEGLRYQSSTALHRVAALQFRWWCIVSTNQVWRRRRKFIMAYYLGLFARCRTGADLFWNRGVVLVIRDGNSWSWLSWCSGTLNGECISTSLLPCKGQTRGNCWTKVCKWHLTAWDRLLFRGGVYRIQTIVMVLTESAIMENIGWIKIGKSGTLLFTYLYYFLVG